MFTKPLSTNLPLSPGMLVIEKTEPREISLLVNPGGTPCITRRTRKTYVGIRVPDTRGREIYRFSTIAADVWLYFPSVRDRTTGETKNQHREIYVRRDSAAAVWYNIIYCNTCRLSSSWRFQLFLFNFFFFTTRVRPVVPGGWKWKYHDVLTHTYTKHNVARARYTGPV